MATAKLTIKGYDDLKTPLNQAKKDLNSFAADAQSIGKKIESAFTIAAVIAAIRKLTSALKECVTEYAEVEQVSLRTMKVWENVGSVTGKTAKQVNDYADSIEKTTYFSAEAVKESAILLAATEKLSDDGFQRALDVSIDLAAALGEDVTAAASTLAKALEDPASALTRLKSIGVTFTEAEKTQIKALSEANQMYEAQSIILDKIEGKYKDVAKAINNTPAGKLDNIKDTLSDIRKSIGESLLDSISPALSSLYEDLLKIYNLIDGHTDKGTYRVSDDLERYFKAMGAFTLQDMYDSFKFSPGSRQSVWNGYLKETYEELEKEIKKGNITWENLEELLKDYRTTFESFEEGSWGYGKYLMGDEYSGAYASYLGLYSFLEDAKYSGKYVKSASSGAPVNPIDLIETSTNAIDESVSAIADSVSDLGSFLTKYVDSTAYQSYEYRKVIENAANALDIINRYREDIVTGDASETVAALLGLPLDILPGEILAMADELEVAIEIYKQKLEDLNTEIESEATSFKAFSIKFDPLGLNNAFGISSNGIRFTDTFSLLQGSGNLTGSDILELDKLFNKYSSLSNSYQTQLLEDEVDRLGELMSKYVDEDSPIADYLLEIYGTLNDQLTQMKKQGKGDNNGSKSTGGWLANLGKAMEDYEQKRNAATEAVFNDFTSQMGEAGDFINRLVTNMAQFTPILGLIVTALHYIIQGLVEELGGILEEFVYWGLEPLREIGRMLGEIFTPIFKEIMPSVIASGKVLMNLFGAIARLLTPIVTVLMKIIGPILTVLADILVSIVGTISWAIDWIAYAVTWALNKITFGWVEQTAKPGSLSDYVSSMMATPGEGYESVSTTTGTNAAYSGMTNIYLNVYQNGTVVGEDGITEFALIIRNELADLAYYSR